jgi:hypothetical protein
LSEHSSTKTFIIMPTCFVLFFFNYTFVSDLKK